MKTNAEGLVIYDVGAGCGHVAVQLQGAGLAVVALDLHSRDGCTAAGVLEANGVTYRYHPGSLVMLCRPCHGLFTEAVITQAIACQASVLYVGSPKNAAADLGPYRRQFKCALTRAGKEGESLYALSSRP